MADISKENRIEHCRKLTQARFGQVRGRPERSMLSVHDFSPATFREIIDGGIHVKAHPEAYETHLQGTNVALLFQKTSTRTRCSFELGIMEMGGNPIYLEWAKSNFTLADLKDEIRVLSRYAELIMARVYKHEDLVTMRTYSEVPIINGLCDRYHPCQALTDLMTVKEYFTQLDGLKLAYIGDGNNVCHSLINACSMVGIDVSVAHPEGYGPDMEIVKAAQNTIQVELTRDCATAVKNADVLYTDTWISMGQEKEKEIRLRAFGEYQINDDLLSHAPEHAIIMHCLPAHRGYEISSSAMDCPNAVVFDQAENRKHVQKYMMAWMLDRL